jgi:hypothetical protein
MFLAISPLQPNHFDLKSVPRLLLRLSRLISNASRSLLSMLEASLRRPTIIVFDPDRIVK